MVPLQVAVTPITALLVSTSSTSASASTASPGFKTSRTSVASAMDSPSCGMMIGTLIGASNMGVVRLSFEQLAGGGGHGRSGRPVLAPKRGMVGDGRVLGIQPERSGVEQAED